MVKCVVLDKYFGLLLTKQLIHDILDSSVSLTIYISAGGGREIVMDVREFFEKMFDHGVKGYKYQQKEDGRIFFGPIAEFHLEVDTVIFQMEYIQKRDLPDGKEGYWFNLPAILDFSDISDCLIKGSKGDIFKFQHRRHGSFVIRES